MTCDRFFFSPDNTGHLHHIVSHLILGGSMMIENLCKSSFEAQNELEKRVLRRCSSWKSYKLAEFLLVSHHL